MTTRDRFDDVVAHWLLDNGPADIRPEAVDRALAQAALMPQHRGIRARLAERPLLLPRARAAVIITLAVLALVTAVIVAGTFVRPTPPLDGGGGWINVSSPSTVVHILSPDGSIDRSFTRGHVSCPRLSPDGELVAYKIRFQGIYTTRLADTEHVRVATFEETNNFGYRDGVWSPNRAYLSYRVHEGGAEVLKVLSAFDEPPAIRSVFTTSGDRLLSEAAWSPDSTRIALAHGQGTELRIDVVDLDGVVQQSAGPLPMALDSIGMLAWSPDGSRVAYLDAEGTGFVLRVVELATGAHRSLGEALHGDFYLASPWSRDGTWLAVTDPSGNLRLVRADGSASAEGPAVAVVTGADARWSPTADVIAMRTSTGLATIRADGTGLVELRSMNGPARWDFAWSPDGTRIVVAEDGGPSGSLTVHNIDASGGGTPLLIATFPTLGDEGLCVSWDAPG